jgi:DUF438 domain-containing protein
MGSSLLRQEPTVSQDWAELLIDDHQTTERVLEAIANALKTAEGPSARMVEAFVAYVVEYADACHNKKEEDHLFPLLEQRGVPRSDGPLAVMLAEHEESRKLLAELRAPAERYAKGDTAARAELAAAFERYSELLKNHYWKENDILYPMGRRVMSEADAKGVIAGIEATEAAVGPDTRAKYYALADEIQKLGDVEDLSANLSPAVMAAMLNTLPVELSFVDENDIVRYFSHEHLPKIFSRTRGVIGMAVQNCHPAKSVHLVNRILADFKAGKREVAEFWIEMGGKHVYIRYFPVRGTDGRYVGCLEVVQDTTRIRSLEGERRLLDD